MDEVEVFGTVKAITDAAILLADGDFEVWLPLSQIEYDNDIDVGDVTFVYVPEWLALEKGLI